MTIQTRTALLFTVLTAFIILVLSVAVYYFASRFVFNDFLKRLELRAVMTSKIKFEEDKTSATLFHELRQQYLEKLPHETDYILRYDTAQKTVEQRSDLPVSDRYYRQVVRNQGATAYTQVDEVHFAGRLYYDRSGTYIIIASAVDEYGMRDLKNLQKVLLLTFIFGVLLVFTVSIFFSRKTFEPVRNIITRVKDISAHNLHLRLQSSKGKDEITELADTFNNMLDRLETAFETQNNFVSNASHELRTPLTTIMGEADIALSRGRNNEEYRQALQVIAREAGRLHHLTSSLLTLAQSGFDGKKQSWELLRIDELLFEVKASVDEIDPENKVELTLEQLPEEAHQLFIQGNPHLLKLALSNVVLNACKYSDNRQVALSVVARNRMIYVTVEDRGIGIPADELKHIYDPFFRASNTNHYGGYGVGLPLTRAIIRLHKGQIQVQSEEGKGTRVQISLPFPGATPAEEVIA